MSFQIFLPTRMDWNENEFSLTQEEGLIFYTGAECGYAYHYLKNEGSRSNTFELFEKKFSYLQSV